jgi:acyl dehydratase
MSEAVEATRPELLCLEDLHEGQRFVSAARTVTAEEIKAFARQFDPQPFHLDEEAAEASFFGGLAASGWHTAALSGSSSRAAFRSQAASSA